jgi:hypothetical protein
MAITQNTYTGDGSTVLFSFTFPYLEATDIKVSLDGTDTTAYTLTNATTIQFNTAPNSGVAIRIYRVTDDEALAAQFYPGSAIRSQDLNDNFTQNLYSTQEANRNASESLTKVNIANQTSDAAVATANAATATANQAAADAATAGSTANTANTTAVNALTAANSAAGDAANAVTAANSALAAVSNVLNYITVTNVANIPSSPNTGDGVRVFNSTGIESFTPLSGLPVGFVGDSGLTVELIYQSPSWVWARYYPIDPENRYGNKAVLTQVESDLNQAQSDILGKLDVTTAASTYLTQTNAASTYRAKYTYTTTAVNKNLINGELCTVTAAGITVTLPASPSQGNEVVVVVGGAFTDTIVARNGSNIMSLAENLTIDRGNVSITLLYVDATRGWRII